jgi:L-threonylcarbamoyladenylate synthase
VSVEEVAAAIETGGSAILPTDTVYGLVTTAFDAEAVRRMYELKGRPPEQPSALMAASLELLLETVPELHRRVAEALLPGAYTLILPNPARRFPWLCGQTPEKIGVRVPVLGAEATAVLDRVRALASTSANLRGGPDPRRLEDVPPELLARCAALDGGELPGRPSTVVDFTGPEPVVLREGAGDVKRALQAA